MAKDCAAKLYEKMEQEFEEFISGLKKMSQEDIVSFSYEKVMKEDFLILFEESVEFSKEATEKLLAMEKPLDYVYRRWLETDYGHMDVLRNFLNSTTMY